MIGDKVPLNSLVDDTDEADFARISLALVRSRPSKDGSIDWVIVEKPAMTWEATIVSLHTTAEQGQIAMVELGRLRRFNS